MNRQQGGKLRLCRTMDEPSGLWKQGDGLGQKAPAFPPDD